MLSTTNESTPYLSLIVLLSTMTDENALYNAYPADGTGRIRLMSRVRVLSELEAEAKRYKANVVLIDSQMIQDAGELKALGQIIHSLRYSAEYPIITVGICYDPMFAETFRRLGALITIRGPITPVELQALNDELPVAFMEAVQERLSPHYHAHYSEDALRIIHSGEFQGHTMSVWSTKGGVGKSFIAREIAVAFGVLAGLRTLLIDADMNCGDQHTYLSLSPDKNIHGLASAFHAQKGKLTPQMVEDYLVHYRGSLFVLNGLYDMAMTGSRYLRGAEGEKFANALADVLPMMGFTYVIYDLGQNYHDGLHLVALRRCTLNLVIATSEKSTANEMERAVRDLRSAVNLSEVRFRLVLNKWDDRLGIDAHELVQRIGLPEFGRIPYATNLEVDLSLNHSKPLVLDKPNPISDAIIHMLSGIYRPIEKIWDQRSGAKQQKRGLFGLGRR